MPYISFLDFVFLFCFILSVINEELSFFSLCFILLTLITGASIGSIQSYDIITYPYYNPFNFMVGFCLYFSIGALYSIFKWYRYNIESFQKLNNSIPNICLSIKQDWGKVFTNLNSIIEYHQNYCYNKITIEMAKLELAAYEDIVNNKNINLLFNKNLLISKVGYTEVAHFIPKINNMKGIIFQWILSWPFLVVHTLIKDPFKAMSEFVFNRIRQILLNIQKKVFKGYEI